MQERKMGGVSRVVAILGVLAFVLSACGGGDGTEPVAETAAAGTESATEGATDNETQETETQDADKESLSLVMGGTASSSTTFAFLTAHARLAGDADGAMTINVRESAGSNENIQLISEGAADFGIAGLSTSIQATKGIGPFEPGQADNIRNLMNYLEHAEYIVVRADAGIEAVEDLAGQPFAPSVQGFGLYDRMVNMLGVLDIEVDPFRGSLEDIVNAMKDGRIVGFAKAGSARGPDASMLDIASAVDVNIIGFTEGQREAIAEAHPEEAFITVDEPPFESEGVITTSIVSNYLADESMPEEAAYRLTKALWESVDEAAETTEFKAAMGRDPSETVETSEDVPLHPGAQRYYEEIGAM